MHFKICLFISLFFLGLVSVQATHAAETVTLEEAVATAISRHPSVAAARAGIDAAEGAALEAYSAYLPELSVTAAGGRIYGDNSTSRGLSVSRGAGYSWLWEGNATMSQLIFDGLATPNRIHAAEARAEAAQFEISDLHEDLALRTTQSYLTILRTQTILDLIKGHELKIRDYLMRIRALIDEGGAEESLFAQGRDIAVQLEGLKQNTRLQHMQAVARYKELTGRSLDHLLARPVVDAVLLPQDASVAFEQAKDHHPELRAAGLNVAALQDEADATEATILPTLRGELSTLRRDQADVIGGEVIDSRALVRLNWNYSLGGAWQAQVRQSRARITEGRAQMDELVNQLERDLSLAYAERTIAREQIKIMQERVRLNQDLFTNNQNQFEAGNITPLQLLQTENNLFNTRLGLMNAEYRALTADYAAMAVMGQLINALSLPAPTVDLEVKTETAKTEEPAAEEPKPSLTIKGESWLTHPATDLDHAKK